MSRQLDEIVQSGHWPERAGLRALLALARRPRGAALLSRLPPADQAALSLLAMERYDDPKIASSLGFDAGAVARRGLALRRSEGRP